MSPKTKASTAKKRSDGFTDDERAAMRERVKEIKASSQRGSRASKADGESDVLAKIAEMQKADRVLATRIHDIVKDTAPELTARTWYGMPAYARDDKVVCYFQSAQKFKSRYATLGFSDRANLDDGDMWPTVYAVQELTSEAEARIAKLVKQAVAEPA